MSQDDKLVKTTSNNQQTKLSRFNNIGLGARVRAAQSEGQLTSSLLDYSRYPNRIILCIDDSGSMSKLMETKEFIDPLTKEIPEDNRMFLCRQACEEFVNVCNPHDTVLGMYTISTQQAFSLSTNYIHLLAQIHTLEATGGTPTIQTLDKIQEKENVTRVVIVSDGESGSYNPYSNEFIPSSKNTLNKYKEKKCIIDTVFIGTPDTNGEREMKAIAEYTGGLFLVFKSGESFRTKFKYLAPAFRGMLTSGQVSIKE